MRDRLRQLGAAASCPRIAEKVSVPDGFGPLHSSPVHSDLPQRRSFRPAEGLQFLTANSLPPRRRSSPVGRAASISE